MSEEELKRERDILKSKCSCFEKIGENQYISILDEYGEEIEQQMNNQIKAIYLLDRSIEEIERLNNIINELEKWLYDRSEFTNFGVIIDKLQELKGEGKE